MRVLGKEAVRSQTSSVKNGAQQEQEERDILDNMNVVFSSLELACPPRLCGQGQQAQGRRGELDSMYVVKLSPSFLELAPPAHSVRESKQAQEGKETT